MQYVALRNIDLLLQKQPDILSKELRVFFCKYDDPSYIKFQKLEIMVRIANDKNVDQLLAELKEYALEVDMDIVKRAVKAIGQVAIKIESGSEKCVNTLLDLINTKVNYVVQEAIVVIKDIFRKYPGYEGIIPTLCKCIDELDEPNARGSLIWIVGEYAEKISNAGDILAGFVDGFMEEFTQVGKTIAIPNTVLMFSRPNYKFSPLSSNISSKSLTNHRPNNSSKKYSKLLPPRMTTLTSATGLMCIGGSSAVTLKSLKTSSSPINPPSPLPLHHFLLSSLTAYLMNSQHYLPSITSHQKLLLARAGMAPTPSKKRQ